MLKKETYNIVNSLNKYIYSLKLITHLNVFLDLLILDFGDGNLEVLK